MRGMIEPRESREYFFDEQAAQRPVNFIERYLRHSEGRHAGKPFLLHTAQKTIVTDLFGWKRRGDGLRRFSLSYFEAGVGAGKSPLLAALGLYLLGFDGEDAAQVFSIASTFTQARVVFDAARKFAKSDPRVAAQFHVLDREIRHPKSGSVWKIVAGSGPGAGANPSAILADELHDFQNAEGFNDLFDRAAKRKQPLTICATNAGESRAGFCWQMREKAVAALEGKGDPSLLPVIWAAKDDARTDDSEALRTANPLIGATISASSVRDAAARAMLDEDDERKFRRLYLGIWPKSNAKQWLNLDLWDRCVSEEGPPANAAVYCGLDMAMSDDLCAVVWVFVTPDRFYLHSHFWLPQLTADRYQRQHAVAYAAWAQRGYVTLVQSPTINSAARRAIADRIITECGGREVKAICFDRYRAEETVAHLENASLPCVAIPQGYSVSNGCSELDRRLKEQSVAIASNDCFRFCAENAETKSDDRGNIWIIKPGANEQSTGTRWRKVDGITAAVTALVEARKHVFPRKRSMYIGSATAV